MYHRYLQVLSQVLLTPVSSFDHVVVEFMEIRVNSDIYKCFVDNRLTNAYSLFGLSDQEIRGLAYDETDDDGNIVTTNKLLPMIVLLLFITTFNKLL
jgi:hypothetical protein